MKQLTIITLVMIFLASCRDKADKKADVVVADSTTTTVEKIDTILEQETFTFFTKPTLKQSAASFRMVNSWKEDSLLTSRFDPPTDFYKKYGALLRYSPDSTKFVDLGSYNVEVTIDRNGAYKYDELGPDTEVSLVEPSKGTRHRLMFLGPGSTVDDAGWMDNETIVLAGKQENPTGDTTRNVIWKFHIPTQTFYEYNPR